MPVSPFEQVASLAPLELFKGARDPLAMSAAVPEMGNAFNQMSQDGRVIEAIGQNIAGWINDPSDEQLDKLAKLYKLCRKSIK